MSYRVYFTVILAVWFFSELFCQGLFLLSMKRPVPRNVSEIYDRRGFRRLIRCNAQLRWFRVARVAGYCLLVLLYMWTDVQQWIAPGPQSSPAAKIGAAVLASVLVTVYSKLPIISQMIRKRYGYCRQEIRFFEKSDWIPFFVCGLMYFLFISLLPGEKRTVSSETGDTWKWIAGGAAFCMAVRAVIRQGRFAGSLMQMPEGTLRSRIEGLLRDHRMQRIRIRVSCFDGGEMNASLTGFPGREILVLNQTLLDNLKDEEICAVVMHELGHASRYAMLQRAAGKLACGGLILLTGIGMFRPETLQYFRLHPAVPVLVMALVMLACMAICILQNRHRNREEYNADRCAVEAGFGAALITALKAIEKEGPGIPNPVPLFHLIVSDHPPLSRRIENIEAHMRASM